MALNGGALNSHAINAAAGFVSAIGGGVVVSIEQEVQALGTNTSNIVQIVGKKSTAGANVTLHQIVNFRKTGSTTIDVEQIVASKKASFALDLEQLVVAVSEPTTFFGRNGYEPLIYIANNKVDEDKLHGNINVTFTENDAPQLSFTIIPDNGVQDLRDYRGKVVVYKIRTASGTFPIFAGRINTPEVEIVDQKITLNCSVDIEQLIDDTFTASELAKVGYYNNSVFSKPKTTLQELRDRISTVPKTLIVDASGIPDVIDIAAKASADFTLGNSDVYRRDVMFKFGSKQRYINKININVDYTFQRLHHQEVTYQTTSPHTTICQMLTGGYTPLQRQLVYSAVQGSDWPVKSGITFGDIYPSGYYKCGDATVGWSTISCTGTTAPTGATTDGNEQLEYTAQACTNLATTLCTSASWIATKRYAQNIKHSYTITVQAPQSQSEFGNKEQDDNFSYSDTFESEVWEDYDAYTTRVPSGLSQSGSQGGNFWIDATTDKKTFNSSMNILLNRAKSEILKSHREDRVLFTRSLWPNISLKHTVYLNADRIEAKGKVYSYTHSINIGTGEATTRVELALSRSVGSTSDSTLTLPTAPTSTPSYPTATVSLPGHYGEDPELTSGSEDWVGHIANKLIWTYTSGKPDLRMTQYPVRFIYDTPEVPSSLRDQSELTATASYNVAIPNDTLTIDFVD